MAMIPDSRPYYVKPIFDSPEESIKNQGVLYFKEIDQKNWISEMSKHLSDINQFFAAKEAEIPQRFAVFLKKNQFSFFDSKKSFFKILKKEREQMSLTGFVLKYAKDLEGGERKDLLKEILKIEDPKKIGLWELEYIKTPEELEIFEKEMILNTNQQDPTFQEIFSDLPFQFLNPSFLKKWEETKFKGCLKNILFSQIQEESIFDLMLEKDLLEGTDGSKILNCWNESPPKNPKGMIEKLNREGIDIFSKVRSTPELPHNSFNFIYEMLSNNPYKFTPSYKKELLEMFSEIDSVNKQGMSPLHAFALLGDFENIKLLLEAGANPLVLTPQNLTPLALFNQMESMNEFFAEKTKNTPPVMLLNKKEIISSLEKAELQWSLPNSPVQSKKNKVHL